MNRALCPAGILRDEITCEQLEMFSRGMRHVSYFYDTCVGSEMNLNKRYSQVEEVAG
ncbi:hypothetical protein [uncultured Ruthenibacterium sp.]|uniref:hypothetical protein n=1 Tax=uncultured Ruthenibacterium sp. TaxID=1905347 RepID=UPI00349EE2ED